MAVLGALFLRRSREMTLGGPLIGRDGELAVLEHMLGANRLVTVTGPGGCGKTRIAVELAERARSRTDPWDSLVVELANARMAEQVVDALLRTLGVRERGGRPPIEVLLDSLSRSRVLIVLDNCEQVAEAVARLCSRLLDRAPDARVLVTSREPLGMADEAVFKLAPLSLPKGGGDVAAVVRSDAGRYFVDRAAAADPGFALTPSTAPAVVRICHELDGLPLALGLAAARVGTIAASDIADGLSRSGRLSLGLLAGSAGDGGRMARLAASAAAARARLGCAPLPPLADRLDRLRESIVDRDGQPAWDAAWAEGHVLALADAIAYARRARGPRDRPPVGWPSLTPAEVEVAQLAATGCPTRRSRHSCSCHAARSRCTSQTCTSSSGSGTGPRWPGSQRCARPAKSRCSR